MIIFEDILWTHTQWQDSLAYVLCSDQDIKYKISYFWSTASTALLFVEHVNQKQAEVTSN